MSNIHSTSVLIGTELPLDDNGKIRKGMIFSLISDSGVSVWVCYCTDPIRFSRISECSVGILGLIRHDGYLVLRIVWSNIARAVRWPIKKLARK